MTTFYSIGLLFVLFVSLMNSFECEYEIYVSSNSMVSECSVVSECTGAN